MNNTADHRRELVFRSRLKNDFEFYAPRCLKIRTKRATIEPFKLNASQTFLHHRLEKQLADTGRVRAIVLKARQVGISTYIGGRFYWRVTHSRGVRAQILAHEETASQNLFEMANRFHEHVPPQVKPSTGAANAKELVFDLLDSGYKVATAGNKGAGRSSTIQILHGCLSPDTFIIDEHGNLRRMDEFSVGNMVRTHTGALAPVSFISRQRKHAFTVTLKGLGQMPLTATAEHRFLTATGWRELGEIEPGEKLLFPVAKICDTHTGWSFRLPDSIRPQGGGARETGPDAIVPTYELGRILGLYLAEGCIIKQSKSKEPSAVCFALNAQKAEKAERWLDALSGLFVSRKTAPRRDSKAVTVTVYGRSFTTFVRDLCGELDTKRLPVNWRECGEEFVRGIIHGYLSGDGHSSKRDNNRCITAPSIRPAISVGIRDALASLGYGWACIGYHPGRSRYGKICRPIWNIRLCGHGVDRMCDELGWEMPPRRRNGFGSVQVKDGYAHIPVLDIEDAGEIEVMDFEIDHADHSYCTVHAATHNSECAFWPNAGEHLAGMMQALADTDGSEAVLESTANGIGNPFHTLWGQAERGEVDWLPVFLPWHTHEEYTRPLPPGGWVAPEEWAEYGEAFGLTAEQLFWAYRKNAELLAADGGNGSPDMIAPKFRQEYPATSHEAFATSGSNAFIAPLKVLKARKASVEGYGPIILGVDPARGGRDKTGMIDRQGRRMGGHVCKRVDFGDNLMAIAADVKREALRLLPLGLKKICIDITGLGAGVYDRLTEILPDAGNLLEPVNFGERANDSQKYANRRSEMWALKRDWYNDPAGVQVPDTDEFQGDECAPIEGPGATHFRSNGQLVLEEKDKIRKRLGFSPDLGDSGSLTFAPDMSLIYSKSRNRGRYSSDDNYSGSSWAA